MGPFYLWFHFLHNLFSKPLYLLSRRSYLLLINHPNWKAIVFVLNWFVLLKLGQDWLGFCLFYFDENWYWEANVYFLAFFFIVDLVLDLDILAFSFSLVNYIVFENKFLLWNQWWNLFCSFWILLKYKHLRRPFASTCVFYVYLRLICLADLENWNFFNLPYCGINRLNIPFIRLRLIFSFSLIWEIRVHEHSLKLLFGHLIKHFFVLVFWLMN